MSLYADVFGCYPDFEGVVNTMSKWQGQLPPGQITATKFPTVHVGDIPTVDVDTWTLHLYGLVKEDVRLTWNDLMAFPTFSYTTDAHCVTTWSHMNNVWEGVAFKSLIDRANVQPDAKFALVHAHGDYSARLRMEDLQTEGVMLAYRHNGKPLTKAHGFPVRLVVPHLYFWKSVKWVRGVEFLSENKPGFWEQRGYHMDGDPWREERYSDAPS